MTVEPRAPLLLYDGVCGFCDGTVRFILRHDGDGRMRFAPLQGATAEALLTSHPELTRMDSLVLVWGEEDRQVVFTRSEAVLQLARYLGRPWSVATMLRLVPRPLRDWGYDLFARYRYRVFGRLATCPVPSPEERVRFLP